MAFIRKVVIVGAVIYLFSPIGTSAATLISGIISTDTTWVAAESPYIVNSVDIASGVTLTIEPGVVIKFKNPESVMGVSGNLNVNGSADNKVYFTSIKDDTVGGDTNGDGDATLPAVKDWSFIRFRSGSTGHFSFTEIHYGGSTNTTSIYNDGGNVTFENSSVSQSGDRGILHFSGTLSVDSSEISNAGWGVQIFNGSVNITNSNLHDNSQYGVAVQNNNVTLELNNNTFSNNTKAAVMIQGENNFVHSGNTSVGTGINGIHVFSTFGAISSNKIWAKDDMPYVIPSGVAVASGGTLTIEPGTIVKFQGAASNITVDGTIDAQGTPEEKIYFTSIRDDTVGGDTNGDGADSSPAPGDWRNVKWNSGSGVLKNVVWRYGGSPGGLGNTGLYITGGNLTISESIFTKNGPQGFFQFGGTIDITKSEISEHGLGIHSTGGTFNISESSIKNNSGSGVVADWSGMVEAANNFWGDPSGPYHSTLNPSGLGNRVSNNVNFIPWLGTDPLISPPVPTRNPVLIVPGLAGTEIFKDSEELWLDILRSFTDIGDEFMDPLQFNDSLLPSDASLTFGQVLGKPSPLFDYSDGLVNEFQNEGYTQDTDLFLLPYDWRYGVNANLEEQLKQKIQDIKTQTGADKVDVIAHSNGGLLVKKYVMDNLVSHFIDKAIFVGVPNTGAPKAIKTLLQGDNFGIPWLADSEIKKIAKNLPAIYFLNPSQQYFDQKGSFVKIIEESFLGSKLENDLDFNETNSFLVDDHQLNSQAVNNSQTLHTSAFDNYDLRSAGVDLYSIVGCRAGTIGKIIERRVETLLGGTKIGYEIEQVPGDGTVPLESATNLPIDSSNKYYALDAEHGTMMTQDNLRQKIVNIISGSELPVDKITQDIDDCGLNGKAISIFSPVDIEVVDQDGNHLGLESDGSVMNEIPNADFEVMGEHKFLYLPEDEGQTYTISLTGTDTGVFTLKNSNITNNEVTETETFSNIPVTLSLVGSFDLENSTTLSLDTDGSGTTDVQLVGIPNGVVKMPYVFSGFLQPINDTAHQAGQDSSVFKAGSTVPVKFQLKKLDGTIVQADSVPEWLAPQKGSAMSAAIDESVYASTATAGTTYKWDPIAQQYVYNWSTKGLAAGYWYKIFAKLDDGNTYSVTIGLR